MSNALIRYKGPPIPGVRNKQLLTMELREQGALQVDPATGVWTMTPAGQAEMERLKAGKTH